MDRATTLINRWGTDPAVMCAGLRELGQQPMTNEAFALTVEALTRSKWQSVQVVAAQTMGNWGSQTPALSEVEVAVSPLRAWLMRLFADRRWFAVRLQAYKALAKCVTEADVSWILDLYFQQEGAYWRRQMVDFMRVVLTIFPTIEAEQRLAEDCRTLNPENSRVSIILLGTIPFPNRQELLQVLWQDLEQSSRDYIETYLKWPAYEQEGYQRFINDWRGTA